MSKLKLTTILMILLFVFSLYAEVPHQISYQGKVIDNSTSLPVVDGSYNLQFKLYTTSSGGTPIWTEIHPSVGVTNGIYHVLLGSINAFPASVDFSRQYWLEVVFDGSELAPRYILGASPYALNLSGLGAEHGEVLQYNAMNNKWEPGSGIAFNQVRADANTWLDDQVTLISGTNITLTQSHDSITIAASGGSSAPLTAGNSIGDGINDTTMVTGGAWGLFRAGNTGYGSACSTHVNLGVNSTTGTTAQNYKYAGVLSGVTNTAGGEYSVVTGGDTNQSGGSYSFVGGGGGNSATQTYNAICGGYGNMTGATHSFIGGGTSNSTSGAYSTICGGANNTGSNNHVFVGGGSGNSASGMHSTIVGGESNVISGHYSAIPGGEGDTITSDYSFAFGNHVLVESNYVSKFYSAAHPGSLIVAGTIKANNYVGVNGDTDWLIGTSIGSGTSDTTIVLGGKWGIYKAGNTGYGNACSTHVNLGIASITGTSGQNYKYATVGGGRQNSATSPSSTVSGGIQNQASSDYATVAGGQVNNASGNSATICGGAINSAAGSYSFIGGGGNHNANGNNSFIGGGSQNITGAVSASVVGGATNTASGGNSIIGGGANNTVSGFNSYIPCGASNNVSGDYSMAFGNSVTVATNYNSVFYNATNPGEVGINNNDPTSALDVGGDIETGSANAFYFGDPTTDGTWRIIRSGDDLIFERREASSWVMKLTIQD